MNDIKVARAKKGSPVLVCRKCLKRIPKGKKLPRALKGELRARAETGRKARIVMTSCFDICPKRAVVVTDGAHLARGEYLLIDHGSVASAAATLTEASAAPQGELRAAE